MLSFSCSDGNININDESANPTFDLDATVISDYVEGRRCEYSFMVNYTGYIDYEDISSIVITYSNNSYWNLDITKYSKEDIFDPVNKKIGPFENYQSYGSSSSLPLALKLTVTLKNNKVYNTSKIIPIPGKKTNTDNYTNVRIGTSLSSSSTDFFIKIPDCYDYELNTVTGDLTFFYNFCNDWVYNAYVVLYDSSGTAVGYSDHFRNIQTGELQPWVSSTILLSSGIKKITIPSSALFYNQGISSSNLYKIQLIFTDGKQYAEDGIYNKYNCKIYSSFANALSEYTSSSTAVRRSGIINSNIAYTSSYVSYLEMTSKITKQPEGSQVSISDNGSGTTSFSFNKAGIYTITTYKNLGYVLYLENYSFTIYDKEFALNFVPYYSKFIPDTNMLVVYSRSPTSCIYEINTEDGSYTTISLPQNFTSVTISPNGNFMCLYWYKSIYLCDLIGKSITTNYTIDTSIDYVAISDNGYLYYTVSKNSLYYLYSMKLADNSVSYIDIKYYPKNISINSANSVLYFFTSGNSSVNFCDLSSGSISSYKTSAIADDSTSTISFSNSGKIFASTNKFYYTPSLDSIPASVTGNSVGKSSINNLSISNDDKYMIFTLYNDIYSYNLTTKLLSDDILYNSYSSIYVFYDLNGIKKAIISDSSSSKLITYW